MNVLSQFDEIQTSSPRARLVSVSCTGEEVKQSDLQKVKLITSDFPVLQGHETKRVRSVGNLVQLNKLIVPTVYYRELSPMSWHSNGGLRSTFRPRWMPKNTSSGRVVKPVHRFEYWRQGRVVVNDNTFQAACFPNDCVAVFPLFRGILYNHLLFTFCLLFHNHWRYFLAGASMVQTSPGKLNWLEYNWQHG